MTWRCVSLWTDLDYHEVHKPFLLISLFVIHVSLFPFFVSNLVSVLPLSFPATIFHLRVRQPQRASKLIQVGFLLLCRRASNP
jgi:hypothetical protein